MAEISPIECLDYNYNEDDDLTWRDAYVSGNETVIAKPLPNLIIGVLGYSDTGDGGSFALSTSEYLYVGKFRWRLKAGVTGGKTGVVSWWSSSLSKGYCPQGACGQSGVPALYSLTATG